MYLLRSIAKVRQLYCLSSFSTEFAITLPHLDKQTVSSLALIGLDNRHPDRKTPQAMDVKLIRLFHDPASPLGLPVVLPTVRSRLATRKLMESFPF